MMYSIKQHIAFLSICILTSQAYAYRVDSTEVHGNVDQIAIFSVAHNNTKAAKLYVTTANNQSIIVKADGKDHAQSYKINELICKVQTGAFNVILPHTSWVTNYSIQFLLRGKEQQPRAAIITNTDSGKVLLRIEIVDQNSYLTAKYGRNELYYFQRRSNVTEQRIRFKNLGNLYVQKELGQAAALMIAAQETKR